MSKLGTILRDLRLERGFTQAEVGEGIGVSPQAVSKWENENGLPDVTQLIPLADYFGVTWMRCSGTIRTRTNGRFSHTSNVSKES